MTDERGSCCDYYDELRRRFRVQMDVLHYLVSDDHAIWLQLYEHMRGKISQEMLDMMLNDRRRCPCHSALDTGLYRSIFAMIADESSRKGIALEDEAYGKFESLAKEFCSKYGIQYATQWGISKTWKCHTCEKVVSAEDIPEDWFTRDSRFYERGTEIHFCSEVCLKKWKT